MNLICYALIFSYITVKKLFFHLKMFQQSNKLYIKLLNSISQGADGGQRRGGFPAQKGRHPAHDRDAGGVAAEEEDVQGPAGDDDQYPRRTRAQITPAVHEGQGQLTASFVKYFILIASLTLFLVLSNEYLVWISG